LPISNFNKKFEKEKQRFSSIYLPKPIVFNVSFLFAGECEEDLAFLCLTYISPSFSHFG